MELVKQFSPGLQISGSAPSASAYQTEQALDEARERMASLILETAPKTPFTADSLAAMLAKSWGTPSAVSAGEIVPVLQSMAKAGKLFIVSKDVWGNPLYLARK